MFAQNKQCGWWDEHILSSFAASCPPPEFRAWACWRNPSPALWCLCLSSPAHLSYASLLLHIKIQTLRCGDGVADEVGCYLISFMKSFFCGITEAREIKEALAAFQKSERWAFCRLVFQSGGTFFSSPFRSLLPHSFAKISALLPSGFHLFIF